MQALESLNAAKRRPRIGVALGGGAALGWAHIGVLRELDRAGLPADIVAGTSIGALVGACYLAGKLDVIEAVAREMTWRRLIAYADPQLGAPGLLRGNAIIAEFVKHLGRRKIEELGKPYVAVASDLIGGREVWLDKGPLEDAVRASISLPGIFVPIAREGALLVDGGMTNPVPVSAARNAGAEIVIAVDVTGDYGGRARSAGLLLPPPNLPAVVESGNQGLGGRMRELARQVFMRSPKRPGLYAVGVTSMALIMRELANARLALDPPDLRIVPLIGHVSPTEFDRAEELIEAGRIAMAEALPELIRRAA